MKIQLRDVAMLCAGIVIGVILVLLSTKSWSKPVAKTVIPDNGSQQTPPQHQGEEGGTLATGELRHRAVRKILEKDGNCTEKRNIEVKPVSFEQPGVLTERWAIRRCGSEVFYSVQFVPTPQGEIQVMVSAE